MAYVYQLQGRNNKNTAQMTEEGNLLIAFFFIPSAEMYKNT